MPVPVFSLVTAICALLLVGLAFRISMLRLRLQISLGDGGNRQVIKSIRAHANNAEHIPIFLLTLLAYEWSAGSGWFTVVCGCAFVLSRLVYSVGMIGKGLHLLRQGGALLSYLSQAVLAVALLVLWMRAH